MLGGIAGWLLGYYAYELIARPVLEFYGSLDKFEVLRSSSSRDAILIMLITSGVAHLPPMKVVTILSGAAAVDIWLFIASAIVARGGKFFLIAWLLRRYGEPIGTSSKSGWGSLRLPVWWPSSCYTLQSGCFFGPAPERLRPH